MLEFQRKRRFSIRSNNASLAAVIGLESFLLLQQKSVKSAAVKRQLRVQSALR